MELKRSPQQGREALTRALFDHSTEALFVLDSAGRIVELNRQACDLLGRGREELIGRSPVEFDAGWDQAFPRGFDARLPCAGPATFQTTYRRSDGTEFPVHVRVAAAGDGAALCFARDLSERANAEEALQLSEERFRTLVQLSFDVYWETDAEHRFTRQEFSARTDDAPAPASEIGKRRWEVPYVEPDEEAWREHRATLEARLPFHDFELARPTAGGGKRYVSVSGFPVFDRSGRFLGYRGVGRHITHLKRAETEHRAHVWFLESMDRINRAVQGAHDLEGVTAEVLQAAIEIFACDRAWLLQPCDPQAATWRAITERTRPHCPAVFDPHEDVSVDPGMAALFAAARSSSGPVLLLPAPLAERFSARSQMAMVLQPKRVQSYLLGLHQCSRERDWTEDEQRLLREIGARLTDALTGVLAFSRLAASERRLEAAQRVAGIGWWERDISTGQLSVSHQTCRIFGVQPAELPQLQGTWPSFIDAQDRPRAMAALEVAMAGGPRYDVEYRVVRRDGGVRVVHSQGDLIRDESGRPVRLFGVMQDITELRQAEQALRDSERELRARQELLDLAQKAASAVAFNWHIGQRERENRWSPELEAMYGLEPGTFDGTYQSWKKLLHPDDWPKVKAAIERANASGDIAAEYRVVHRDGMVHWMRAKGRMFFDAAGQPERMVGFMFDVSDTRQAEEALRASEERFRTVFDRATDAFFLLDTQLNVVDANRQACESLGRSREELVGMQPRDFDVELDEAFLRRLADRSDAGKPLTFETRHRRKDGTIFPVEVRTGTLRQAGVVHYLALARDITERKHAEAALRASEARFRTFVDRATDAFFLLDDQLAVVDVNRQACEGLGYSREELVGMHPRQFDAGLDDRSIELLAQRALTGETITFETMHRRRDGTVFPVEIRSGTFHQGEQMLYLALARDISERKLAEETVRAKDQALQAARVELARVSRVVMLGELTASIAHEVNQPLGAMVANAAAAVRWLSADPSEAAKARRALQSIADDGRRAGEVIRRIRALVKRQPPRMAMVGVNETIGDVVALAQQELRANGVILNRMLSEGLPAVPGDRIQLQQVLLNLIVNAIEAMSAVQDRPRELTIASRLDGPAGVLVEVRDTGPGLAREHADHLFEAFYTTKDEGLGIGLSISRSIVEAHGGQLSAAQNVPYGAVFQLSLPVNMEGVP
jgi:PAS domain S-box-containing protein